MSTLGRIYKLYMENPTITTDSRNVVKGSIFFALKGENFDGNKFALDSIKQGCVAAVVDDPTIDSKDCIYVENVLETLQALSRYHRRALGIKVLAITGTNGKTTTKELINSVLSQKYSVYATKGNLNNHIGVPLTLLSVTSDIDVAIVEMGANHPGEIKLLASIAEPNYGLITNIGKAHLEGFGSFEGIKRTKGELYEYLAHNNGVVFYNPDNENLEDLIKLNNLNEQSVTYGFGIESIKINAGKSPYLEVDVKPLGSDSAVSIQTSLVGNYNFENVFAAITVGLYMGVSIEQIKNALERYTPSNSRSQLVKTKYNTVVLDAYNANPTSMEAALRNFALLDGQSKVVIIGEMLELGQHSEVEHRKIADLVRSLGISSTILVGKGFEKYSAGCLFFKDSELCAKYLESKSIRNSLVLVKGSRGVKLEKVMGYL